ncbi:MAG: gamma-glutamyltransferase [Thermoleophilia bacterium]|nr:gamma-glutamyltransferase [Thermoleophilia bacterium]
MATGHPCSARAGAQILAEGGNAFDAALAAAFAGAVCESALTGPCAGGFLLARPASRKPTLLDFFVAAPGLGPDGSPLRPEELWNFTVPFGAADQVFHHGPASVATPGMTAGLLETHRRWCTLPLTELVAPATRLARDGVTITAEAAYLNEILADMLKATPQCAEIHAPAGYVLAEGETLRIPDLADTLEAIAAGKAKELESAIQAHQATTGGHVTGTDLDEYQVIEREPLMHSYRGVQMFTNPPPSSGGLLIAAALDKLEAEAAPIDDATHYVKMARAGAYANSMRDESFPDALHHPDAATRLIESRKPTGSTTHVSAVDAEGNLASMSSSNGAGSGVVVPGTGVMLNNIMGEEDLNPGGFGLVPPGRRMTSMMAPSILLGANESAVAIGSAGSNRLRSAILQTVMSVVDAGMDLKDAIARPRVHPEGIGVDIEAGVPGEAIDALFDDGHRVRRWSAMNLFFGGVSAVAHKRGEFSGAGDPRRGGHAAVATKTGQVIDL